MISVNFPTVFLFENHKCNISFPLGAAQFGSVTEGLERRDVYSCVRHQLFVPGTVAAAAQDQGALLA